MKELSFRKMDGAGNDFIFVHGPDSPRDPAVISRLCSRRRGVGGDGYIVLTPLEEGVLAFDYFNSDGSAADFCGNGLRCAMEYAALEGLVSGETALFRTRSGELSARRIRPGLIRISMPAPAPFREVKHGNTLMHVTKVGVPHAVVECQDLENTDVNTLGRELRFAKELGPEGANVDFVRVLSDDSAQIRTYERGVEAETLACGTGITASAAWLFFSRGGNERKKFFSRGGDVLEIEFSGNRNNLYDAGPSLTGPALCRFRGTLDLETYQKEMDI